MTRFEFCKEVKRSMPDEKLEPGELSLVSAYYDQSRNKELDILACKGLLMSKRERKAKRK